jgi:UDP-glucose 4-epimerase
VNRLAELLMKVAGRQVEVVHDAPALGEIKFSMSDTTKAREVLGFTPKVALEDGLGQVVRHIAGR